MDQLGIRCEVYVGREVLGSGQRLSIVEIIQQEFRKVKSTLHRCECFGANRL